MEFRHLEARHNFIHLREAGEVFQPNPGGAGGGRVS